METRKLGNSDLQITPVGFGAWAIGGSGYAFGWGAQGDEASIEAIRRALELGINWIDTAAVYGLGHSEEIVARALDGWSETRPYIFTKCGMRWDEQGNIAKVLSPDSIRYECEASLRRLRVEAIDLYQIHWPTDNDADIDDGWGMMRRLQEESKVRWIGVSNFNVEQLRRAQSIAPVTSLQPPYSLIKRQVEQEILPYCQQEGIGVIVYSPMASGLLTGAMTRERAAELPEDDWRRHNEEFNEPKLSRNLDLVERLRRVGARHGRTPGETAIAWTLRHAAVTGAIVGARSPRQVEGIIGAGDFRLTEEEVREIEGEATEAPALDARPFHA
ncbi:MAG TPA: aldo/keto reductase [Pyrinomonadaceae bacterium]|nr:aldo/keto reductase [Pyrinomonadaceae bacterium]